MTTTSLLRCLLLAVLLAAEAPAQDKALAPLAQSLAQYREARGASEGVDEARSSVEASLAAMATAQQERVPLRLSSAIGRALWLSWKPEDFKLKPGKVTKAEYRSGSFTHNGLSYAYRVPKSYEPEGQGLPLILSIPDENEQPADHLRTHWTERAVLDGSILVSLSMPKDVGTWNKVMAAGRPGGVSHVLTVLRLATQQLAVDPDRIYLVGRGRGVEVALATGDYSPQRFAGVIGRAGDTGEQTSANFSNLPTFFAGGGPQARAFQTSTPNSSIVTSATEAELWHWMRAHPRTSHPSSVTVVVGMPFPTRTYWLRLSPDAMDCSASATIDREAGRVIITGRGVSHVTLHLNDQLLDLDRPLIAICNGVTSTITLQRNLPVTLGRMTDGTSDTGCIYVAQVRLDMSGLPTADARTSGQANDPDFKQRREAAADDAAGLWALYGWCNANKRNVQGGQILARLLRLYPHHERARAALGHVQHKTQWFSTQAALDRYLATQDSSQAEARGHVQHKGQWMHPEERSFINKKWAQDHESGLWSTPEQRRLLEAGGTRQDTRWLDADQATQAERGLWLVDGEWLGLAAANRRHSELASMWQIPDAEVLLHTTTDRATGLWALREMRRAMHDLRRVFGAQPRLPLRVGLLRDEEQYDRFAFGDPDGRRAPSHTGRMHVIHNGYFAESHFVGPRGKRTFMGMGVAYWDAAAPYGNQYGVHAARLAVGLAYADAIDPSPRIVRSGLKQAPPKGYYEHYQTDKRLPAWLRMGGAVYAERYFFDETVDTSVPSDPPADPYWARAWSLSSLASRGELDSLETILRMQLDPDDRDGGQKLLIEAGLVVSFILDGGCEPVEATHAEFKRALASGRLRPSHVQALVGALLNHEAKFLVYAGQ